MTMTRAIAVTLVLLALISFCPAKSHPSSSDLDGAYAARGVGVGGRAYEAQVTLTKNGDTYLVRWKFADGEFNGVGLLDHGLLSVGWANRDKAGVVVYTVKDADTLDGRWADGTSDGRVFTETLTRTG